MLDALGNIGDFLGGIGVVVTLVYLSVQIRQNSKAVKAGGAQAVLQSLSEFFRGAAESPDLGRIVELGMTDSERLDEDQYARFFFWLFSWLRILERAHHQFELGNISESSWAGQASHAKSVLAAPAVQRFWAARRSAFSVEFQEFVDSSQPVRESLSPREAMAAFRGEPTAAQQGDEAGVE